MRVSQCAAVGWCKSLSSLVLSVNGCQSLGAPVQQLEKADMMQCKASVNSQVLLRQVTAENFKRIDV